MAVLVWRHGQLTQRAIITKTVPIIGGAIGGAWNYTEIRMVGKRAIAYHFDDQTPEPGPPRRWRRWWPWPKT